jgi:hypothetical protein
VRPYNRLTYWENRNRVRTLGVFKQLVVDYFGNIDQDRVTGERTENNISRAFREQINRDLMKVHQIVSQAGVNTIIEHPSLRRFDLLINIFATNQLPSTQDRLFDFIDMAIGVYEHDKRKSLLRVWNPLFWIGYILEFLATIPFMIIGGLGFDRAKFEYSPAGKLTKGILEVLEGIASLTTIWVYRVTISSFIVKVVKLILNIFSVFPQK